MERHREPGLGQLPGCDRVGGAVRVRERPRSWLIEEETGTGADLVGDARRGLVVEPQMAPAMAADHLSVRAHGRDVDRREVEGVCDLAARSEVGLDQPLEDRLDGIGEVSLERALQHVDRVGAPGALALLECCEVPGFIGWQGDGDRITEPILAEPGEEDVQRVPDGQRLAGTAGEREEHAAPAARDETWRHRACVVGQAVVEREECRVVWKGRAAIEGNGDGRPIDDGPVLGQKVELAIECLRIETGRGHERSLGRVADVMPHDRQKPIQRMVALAGHRLRSNRSVTSREPSRRVWLRTRRSGATPASSSRIGGPNGPEPSRTRSWSSPTPPQAGSRRSPPATVASTPVGSRMTATMPGRSSVRTPSIDAIRSPANADPLSRAMTTRSAGPRTSRRPTSRRVVGLADTSTTAVSAERPRPVWIVTKPSWARVASTARSRSTAAVAMSSVAMVAAATTRALEEAMLSSTHGWLERSWTRFIRPGPLPEAPTRSNPSSAPIVTTLPSPLTVAMRAASSVSK